MKKTNRLVTIFLMVCMVLASGGLLYATMYASGAGTQSTQTTVAFDAPSGIRYNELTGAFEVFSGVGVSWIGSEAWVSTLGEYDKSTDTSPPETGTAGVWHQTTRTSTYNIMCDIAYKSVFQPSTTTFVPAYNEAFNNGITLEEGGKIYGRGFFLSGFPMRNTDKSSALIAENRGIIRNINMTDVSFANVAGDRTSAGILCAVNDSMALIDDCAVYGEYITDKFVNLFGIAAENKGTIMNSSNNAKLTNYKAVATYTAGIAEIFEGSNTVSNTNNASITAGVGEASVAGIGISKTNANLVAGGNTNNGELLAKATVSGIIGGIDPLVSMRAINNTNNGRIAAAEIYEQYHGKKETQVSGVIPQNGIRWNADLGLFEIYNSAGVSYIASGFYFSATGDRQTTDTSGTGLYKVADGNAHYRLMNDIEYNESDAGFYVGFKDVAQSATGRGPIILSGGIVDGGGYTMSGFPLRSVGKPGSGNIVYASAFLLASVGKLTNLNFDVGNSEWNEGKGTNYGLGYVGGLLANKIERITCAGDLVVRGGVTNLVGIFSANNGVSEYLDWGVVIGISDTIPLTSRECINMTNIVNSTGTASPYGNGFTGTSSNTLTVSTYINFGNIQGGTRAAGLAAGNYTTGSTLIVEDVINFGNITANTASGDGAAGIYVRIGGTSSSVLQDLINYGNITSAASAGGIFTRTDYPAGYSLAGLKNFGDVMGSTHDNTGAIVGTVATTGRLTLKNCYNNGKVGIEGEMKEGDAVRFVGNEDKYWNGGGADNVSEVKN